jgi:hypothetical protein
MHAAYSGAHFDRISDLPKDPEIRLPPNPVLQGNNFVKTKSPLCATARSGS